MKIQYIRKKNIWPYLSRNITSPPGTRGLKFSDVAIIKKYVFSPLLADGSRQPESEARVAMRIAAMVDNRYCCGDVNDK